MASEMRAIDIDLSFAPVADLARGNMAIGERAFHADPAVTSQLVQAYARGMHLAGMAVTLKHFPGHGSVLADTHFDVADDGVRIARQRTGVAEAEAGAGDRIHRQGRASKSRGSRMSTISPWNPALRR